MTASGASGAEFQAQAYICPVCFDDHQPSPCWKKTADLARQLSEAREFLQTMANWDPATEDTPPLARLIAWSSIATALLAGPKGGRT